MKVFQIEEPDGSPADPDMPGAAVGIDVGGTNAAVAVAVGGNPALLADRDGFELDLPVPPPAAPAGQWQALFEGLRVRAERALARPVTHAVIAGTPDLVGNGRLEGAATAAGLIVLRVLTLPAAAGEPALVAAVMAEDLAPRGDAP